MKYYAVTDDPRELYHYGVKGMKWGQHLFGEDLRPKSPAYKRAASKLRATVKSNKRTSRIKNAAKSFSNFAKRSATQLAYNARQLQDQKYQKAVLKAQRQNDLTKALYSLDKENGVKRQIDLDRKREAVADRLSSIRDYNDYKTMKSSIRAEKKFPKYVQEAREGTLHYGKLSEDQIGRIQDRLTLEAGARRLGSTEYPKFRTRMKRAVQEGMIQGTTSGIAAGMKEVAIAKVQNKMANKRALDKQNEIRAHREHESTRIRNDKSHAEIREDLKNEAYEAQVRAGDKARTRVHIKTRKSAEALQSARDREREHREMLDDAHEQRKIEARDTYNDTREGRKREAERENALRDLDAQAKFANDYDMLMPGSSGNNKNGGNKNGNQRYTIDELKAYYQKKNAKATEDADARKRMPIDWDNRDAAEDFKNTRFSQIAEMAEEKRNARNKETPQEHASRVDQANARYLQRENDRKQAERLQRRLDQANVRYPQQGSARLRDERVKRRPSYPDFMIDASDRERDQELRRIAERAIHRKRADETHARFEQLKKMRKTQNGQANALSQRNS